MSAEVIMQLHGLPDGTSTPYDGQYLKDFDFEDLDGRGNITMTADPLQAKRFADMHEAFNYYQTIPKSKPVRLDGKPNRPLTATNWLFQPAPPIDDNSASKES